MNHEFSVPLFLGTQDGKPVVRYYRLRQIRETKSQAELVHCGADARIALVNGIVYSTDAKRGTEIEDVLIHSSRVRVNGELDGSSDDLLMISSFTSCALATVLNHFGVITRTQQRAHAKYAREQLVIENMANQVRQNQDDFRHLLYALGTKQCAQLMREHVRHEKEFEALRKAPPPVEETVDSDSQEAPQ
jgi:hypothetical protein